MLSFSQEIGIDLGTSNTLVCAKNKGIVLRAPSVVAVDLKSSPARVVAVGEEAKTMMGRTPGSITAVKPLKDSVIADFEITSQMLKELIKIATNNSPFGRARVLISIPSNITEVEKRAVHDAAKGAGARYVSLIAAPMAAAIGAGLPVTEATGSMIVDIGGGTTEVSVISLGDIIASRTTKTAGDSFDDAIVQFVRKKYNLLIGEVTAEEIKLNIGSAFHYEGEGAMSIRGRNLVDGLPNMAEITSEDVREALSVPLSQIADAVRYTLEKTPPEIGADIMTNGIVLTGGSALLRGIDKYLENEISIQVKIAPSPADCTITGEAICLQKDTLKLKKQV